MEDRPEQIFFNDEALDRAVGMIMTLSAELFVTRDRLTVLERVLTARGFLEFNELDDYQPDKATRLLEEFVNDLSNWYVRRSRRRFWRSGTDTDKLSAYETLYECLVTIIKLLAPMTPFITEKIYQNLESSCEPVWIKTLKMPSLKSGEIYND